MSNKTKNKTHETKGNIFADLGLNDAEELHAKSGLVFRIAQIIEKRKLTQAKAASILGIDQPKVSNLLRGQLEGFSTDRLFRFLNALDCDIDSQFCQDATDTAMVRYLTTDCTQTMMNCKRRVTAQQSSWICQFQTTL